MPAHCKFPQNEISFPFPSPLRRGIDTRFYDEHTSLTLSCDSAWIDVSITMDTADPNYKQTQAKGQGVTGDLTTNDGGKTWTVAKIGIPEHSF